MEVENALIDVALISITAAVLITMIGVGVDPAPNLHLDATTTISFSAAFLSVTNVVFAFAGHVAFFSFISEFRDPREFPKALYLLQVVDITMYLIVAIVIYRYTGADVKSPALGSASTVVMKVAYGIAMPTVSKMTVRQLHEIDSVLDLVRGCNLRPRSSQVHLRSYLSWHQTHVSKDITGYRILGCNYPGSVVDCVDNR